MAPPFASAVAPLKALRTGSDTISSGGLCIPDLSGAGYDKDEKAILLKAVDIDSAVDVYINESGFSVKDNTSPFQAVLAQGEFAAQVDEISVNDFYGTKSGESGFMKGYYGFRCVADLSHLGENMVKLRAVVHAKRFKATEAAGDTNDGEVRAKWVDSEAGVQGDNVIFAADPLPP